MNETDLDESEGLYNMGGLTKWGLPPRRKDESKSPSQFLIPYQPQPLAPTVGNPSQSIQQQIQSAVQSGSLYSSRQGLPVEKQSSPIIGYRAWILDDNITDLGLYAANKHFGAWKPGVQHAVCKDGNQHPAPDDRHGCGYYLCRTPIEATKHVRPNELMVVGACVAWGQIIEHKKPDGWRCSDVKILALIQWDKADAEQLQRLEWIARFYGVPLVKNADALKALATEMYG